MRDRGNAGLQRGSGMTGASAEAPRSQRAAIPWGRNHNAPALAEASMRTAKRAPPGYPGASLRF
jgi:hypothetical protein